ncbi:unnamed protein product [Amoebophrya sp. A120]|nr:unnamed protein product [Amoebophrya sp. A120]|eukprot:GSA120T00019845001.1
MVSYDRISYEPPVPQVFGSGVEMELPKFASSESSSGQLPSSRMKLKDRLALYEEDDPAVQKWICCLGIFCPPFIWWIGALMHFQTPHSKVLTREAGQKNFTLAVASSSILFLVWAVHHMMQYVPQDGNPFPPGMDASQPHTIPRVPSKYATRAPKAAKVDHDDEERHGTSRGHHSDVEDHDEDHNQSKYLHKVPSSSRTSRSSPEQESASSSSGASSSRSKSSSTSEGESGSTTKRGHDHEDNETSGGSSHSSSSSSSSSDRKDHGSVNFESSSGGRGKKSSRESEGESVAVEESESGSGYGKKSKGSTATADPRRTRKGRFRGQ